MEARLKYRARVITDADIIFIRGGARKTALVRPIRLRYLARARRISQVGRDKIRLATCGTDFRDRLLAALGVAAYDQDMDAKLGQFIGRRPPDAACPVLPLSTVGSSIATPVHSII